MIQDSRKSATANSKTAFRWLRALMLKLVLRFWTTRFRANPRLPCSLTVPTYLSGSSSENRAAEETFAAVPAAPRCPPQHRNRADRWNPRPEGGGGEAGIYRKNAVEDGRVDGKDNKAKIQPARFLFHHVPFQIPANNQNTGEFVATGRCH